MGIDLNNWAPLGKAERKKTAINKKKEMNESLVMARGGF